MGPDLRLRRAGSARGRRKAPGGGYGWNEGWALRREDQGMMKNGTLRIALVIGMLAAGACTHPADPAADIRAIEAGEATWARSIPAGDVAAMQALLDEDYRGVAPDGSRTTKAEELEGLKSGPQHFVSNRLVEVHVRLYGDAAVAEGIEQWEKRDGEPRTGRWVWTDTWVRREGRWRIVASADIEVGLPPAPTP